MEAQDAARRAPRFATDATLTVGEIEHEIRGNCVNLSRGGLCSELESSVPAGETYPLRLSLVFDADVESEPLTLNARAVWCTQIGDSWQVGFQFLALDPSQTSFLQMFLRYLGGDKTS
tara:strand:+ start:40008 stop:40361 length:354 start_codon:yes stop_codon:yes gene_type:complete